MYPTSATVTKEETPVYRPRLVTVAHGTRHPDGPPVVDALVRAVARRLGGVEVVGSYVELSEPSFASVMAAAEGPSVVVPLLLSTGYHVKHDIPVTARSSPHPVTVTRPLGPHPLLAAAGAQRLRDAGARRGDAVVLVAAGSTDPAGTADALAAGRLLAVHWGGPVRVAFLSGTGPTLPEACDELRAAGHRRIAVAPYLLAPGHFAVKARRLAAGAGVSVCADLLGGHPLVAELVIRRHHAARRALLGAGNAERPLRRSHVA